MNSSLIAHVLLASSAVAQTSKLDWKPLPLTNDQGRVLERASRATLTVPMDRSKPDGKTIELQLARLEGKSGGTPLLYLEGGPGGSGTSWAVNSMWESFRDLGDVILLDQRGCGRSQPPLYLHPSAGVPEDVFRSHEAFGEYLRTAGEEALSALRAGGYDPSAFHNLASVEDLEDLRAALGVPKLNVVGHSYGTHLGLLFLRHHPTSVANAVLIGVEGPDMTHKYPQTYDVHWKRLMLAAKKDPALAAHADELDGLLSRALAKLDEKPLVVRVNDPVTKELKDYSIGSYGLLLFLILDLGDNTDIPVLPRLLAEVVKGETRMLGWFARKRLSLAANLPLTLFTMDGGAGASAGRMLSIRDQSRSPFAPVIDLTFPALDKLAKPVQFSDDYRAPVLCTVRTLFISGSLDSNTPPQQAEEIRWGFTDAAHLISRNGGHEGCWFQNARSLDATHDFFAGEDVAHRDIDLPPLSFAPLEGPSQVRHPSLE